MIHLTRPAVSPVANIVFALFCFARFWKVGTDGQHMRKQLSLPAVTVGRPSGSIFWDQTCMRRSVTEHLQIRNVFNFDWNLKVKCHDVSKALITP